MSARHLPSFPPPAPGVLEQGSFAHPESADEASATRSRRRLSLVGGEAQASLARHPRDGWQRARLFPMGKGARRALKGLMRSLSPTAEEAPRGASVEHHVEVYVRFWMSYMPRWMARGMWLLLFVVEWSPFLFGQGLSRLSALPPRRRAKVIARLARSRFFFVRRILFILNSLFMSAYYDNQQVHGALRYAPVPFIRDKMALRRALLGA